jgi:hypothetical protein
MTTPSDLDKLSAEARERIGALRGRVIRRANGALPYDYIVPSGVYEEQWDWDAFFVGLHLISVDRADDENGAWLYCPMTQSIRRWRDSVTRHRFLMGRFLTLDNFKV